VFPIMHSPKCITKGKGPRTDFSGSDWFVIDNVQGSRHSTNNGMPKSRIPRERPLFTNCHGPRALSSMKVGTYSSHWMRIKMYG
jgi:hypothetical protein